MSEPFNPFPTTRDLPYAAEHLDTDRFVLEARGVDDAALDDAQQVTFFAHDFRSWTITRHVDELPGTWREILADPGNRNIPGRAELFDAITESMKGGHEFYEANHLRLIDIDSTP